ncbi:MAG: MBL fold metallo-hydrolase [Peptostreptococcales bacterium]
MKIRFLGGTETITGSCHLIETDEFKILLDCGQFQGNRVIEDLNYMDFDFNPREIDFLLLSHAHIDHSGRIPLLVKQGFCGDIISTKATYDLAEIMLRDSGHIHEKEAEWKNRKRMRAGKKPIDPLYTERDGGYAMRYFKPILYDQIIQLSDNLKVRFNDAGHILGSAIIEIWITENKETIKVVFSGDLGMNNKPILRDPARIKEADYVIMETTYGDRLHKETEERIDLLMNIILETTRRGGRVIIPSFAVGRTQEILYELNHYYEYHKELEEELNRIKVYVDSPMATTATEIFELNPDVFDKETRKLILSGDNPFDFKNLYFTRTTDESIELTKDKTPKIIISASGMCDAGRIKHHLKHNLWDEKNSVVFVGYQAEGTLGRRIRDGQEVVKIFGEEIEVKAEIHEIEGFSGHADQRELIEWLRSFQHPPREIFLVHGEGDSKEVFAQRVKEELNYNCVIADKNTEYEIHKNYEKEIYKEPQLHISMEELIDLSDRLYRLRNEGERVLCLTRLAVGNYLSDEEHREINNKLVDLEKNIMGLSMIIADKEIPER